MSVFFYCTRIRGQPMYVTVIRFEVAICLCSSDQWITETTASSSVLQDISGGPLGVKYSKNEVWQRKPAQRLRRGVPSILLAQKFRRQVEKIQHEQQASFHRPLMTLPNRHRDILPYIQINTSHK